MNCIKCNENKSGYRLKKINGEFQYMCYACERELGDNNE